VGLGVDFAWRNAALTLIFFIFLDCFLKNDFKMGKNRMFLIKNEKRLSPVSA
jgi:hypothetical protein